MRKELENSKYKGLLKDIKERIRTGQYQALRAVNKELISLYWDIGKMIIKRQEQGSWGKSVIKQLAKDIQNEYPSLQGFSAQNLWKIRQFYQSYAKNEKLSPLVREIGWTHNTIILMQCKDDLEREFYIRMTKKMGWTKNVLLHQIKNKTYEKTITNQTNFDKTVPEAIRNQAKLAVKDEYLFDFLELGEEHSERQLEKAVLAKIEYALRESKKPIGIAQYKIVSVLPESLRKELPSLKQIEGLVEGI